MRSINITGPQGQYLTRKEAAAHLEAMGLPVRYITLQKLATNGGGPAFEKVGTQAVYAVGELDRWGAERLALLGKKGAAA